MQTFCNSNWSNSHGYDYYINVDKFNPSNDRVMICGSESMTFELKKIFEDLGSTEGSTKIQGGLVIEKAFAEK